jgi:hypothetical protein
MIVFRVLILRRISVTAWMLEESKAEETEESALAMRRKE